MVYITMTSAASLWILLVQSLSFIHAGHHTSTVSRRSISKLYPRLDFDRKMKEKQRKDEIRRKICDIIGIACKQNISVTTTPSPDPAPPYPNLKNRKEFRDASLVFSEPTDKTNDSHCMQFRLPESYFRPGYELSGADLCVHIKVKKRRKRRRRRSIVIRVSKISDDSSKRKTVARLRFQPNESDWYKVPLPVTLVRKLHKLRQSTLQLCIHCKKCNRKMRITFPLTTSNGKRRTKKRRRKTKGKRKIRNFKTRRLRKNRPILMCHIQKKSLQSTQNDFRYGA